MISFHFIEKWEKYQSGDLIMFDRLKTRLSEEVSLTDEDWSLLVKHIQYKELLKNEILLRSNEVASWTVFLVEGILRIYNRYIFL